MTLTVSPGQFLSAVDDTMRAVIDQMPDAPDFSLYIRYPLGWVNADGTPCTQVTGKRIRPQLVLLACQAAGGDWHTALPAAAAVELLHNFSLIHDDIQDESDTRHNRPTVWKLWGRANAINAGDAMFTLAYMALARLAEEGVSPGVVQQVWQVFNRTNLELTRGQHLDMRFEKQPSVSTEAYISMVTGKSAALLAACAEIGALIGSGQPTLAAQYAAFGLNLGIAFQIRDDILGIWGDPSVTGKSAATDILARKKSLPVLYALERSEGLRSLYAQAALTTEDVQSAVGMLDDVGARAYTLGEEARYFQAAIDALEGASPQGEAGSALMMLVEALFRRSV